MLNNAINIAVIDNFFNDFRAISFLNIDAMILIKNRKILTNAMLMILNTKAPISLRELFISFRVIFSNHNLSFVNRNDVSLC